MVLTVYGGRTRRQYQFEVRPLHDPQPAIPGCYIFATKQANDRYALVYIGQTGNLSERFVNHHKWPCIMNHQATHLCVYFTDTTAQAKVIERDLLENYAPSCND